MCSCCYSDPSWDEIHYRRQGAVDVEDFEDEIPYRHPPRKRKKSKPRSQTRRPCPESEDGKHVYVWVPYISDYTPRDRVFLDYFGYARREVQTCCGCLAQKGYGRETDRYTQAKEHKWRKRTGGEFAVKRGEPISRYRRWGTGYSNFKWEDYHEGYQQALAKWENSAAARKLEELALRRRIAFRLEMLGRND